MSITTVLLVRHGQTDAIGRYLAGTAEGTPLNATGQAQARRLAERLGHLRLSAVFSSPLLRSRDTAAPVADARGVPVQIVEQLTEVGFGEWTGRSFQSLEEDSEWRRFNTIRTLVRPPGGELMLDVQRRAVSALLDLAASNESATILVVSHGDVIRAALMF